MSLSTYRKKRDFKSTREPDGVKKKSQTTALSFVIQRHDASHLHYDFRLELDGVLKSWAIPKGPSLNPKDKRLAVAVEDHPLEYGKFEGEIPQGNYGAGSVEIWDKGTYEIDPAYGHSGVSGLRKGIKDGSLKFILHGDKLKGSFALVRVKYGKGDRNWLLIKHRDEYVRDDYDIEDYRGTQKTQSPVKVKAGAIKSVRSPQAKERKLKQFINPMLATLTDAAFDDADWIFELKWDGYRAVAETTAKVVKLYSRNGLSFLNLYPEVADELMKIKGDHILDGEICVLDDDNKPSFQKLQHFPENRDLPIVYYVFDCVKYDGKDITELPLTERKKLLKTLIPKSDIIIYSDHVEKEGKKFFAQAAKMKMEGVIAKHASSLYESGRRTRNWLKIKNVNTQEAIIAGYTQPRRSRKHFGALVLAIQSRGKLRYIGHSGTGFTEKILENLYDTFQPLVRSSSPFSEKIPVKGTVTWLEPELVCNVKYTELTEGGIMRHPVFTGLRIDKQASEVDHVDSQDTTLVKHQSIKDRKMPRKQPRKDASEIGEAVRLNGHIVPITNSDKAYWPTEGITKREVIDFYQSVSKFILPHLKDRPQSLRRNPNGIKDKGFFHKDAGDAAPDWVKHVAIYADSSKKDINYILCNDAATLAYLNNLGCIELNTWNSKVKTLDNPDYVVLDLDPSPKNDFDDVIAVAKVVKDILDDAGVTAYCKTSGASGIHIYVPVHAKFDYNVCREFAEKVAQRTVELLPRLATTERMLKKRKGKVYVDWVQNSRGQTLAAVYSIRPVPGASVSTPIEWKELKKGLDPMKFNIRTVSKRLAKHGDLFKDVLKKKNDLKKSLKSLRAQAAG